MMRATERRSVVRLLLINPRSPESFWSFRWALDEIVLGKRAVNPPLGLATLAALTPSSWEIEIVDENVESVPRDPRADVVGICGMGVQLPRQRELLEYYRDRGYYVVAGGSYASLCPEEYFDLADTVAAGEAEYIWPRFCADFEAGHPRALYRESGEVSLHDSPPPRFDLLKLDRYTMVSLQFSRGCPFQCEFCDIIIMFGRKPRTKSTAQVLAELESLRLLGAENVFFVDDNFIGNKPQARALLRAIGDYQREHGTPFRFGTEASLNLAQDEELMRLMREANFQWVFIGIESPDAEALKETQKLQNTREDMLVSLRRLYANAIEVFAGFIVGFDHDTVSTFERQHEFIRESGIQVAMVGLLTAIPRTPLYERLEAEGRLTGLSSDNTRLATNVIPKSMTAAEMTRGYQNLYRRLLSDRGIADRIINKMRHLAPAPRPLGYSATELLRILWRVMNRGIRPGGITRWWHFTRTTLLATPSQVGTVISDWISGLSMKQYAERYLLDAARESRMVERTVARLRQLVPEVSFELPNVSVTLRNAIDSPTLRRTTRHLRRLLRKTEATVTLHIEGCDAVAVERLLRRLSRHGDRIFVSIGERLREIVDVDWSAFQLAVAPSRG
jgi:radical SAM superfamily enzyme YgiQ (UPF0313 family)